MKIALIITGATAQEIVDLQNNFPNKLRSKAVNEDSQTVNAEFSLAIEDLLRIPRVDTSSETDELERKLYARVEDLNHLLSIRAINGLRLNEYMYVGTIVQKQPSDILQCKGLGKVYLNEISSYLAEVGLAFGMKLESFPNPNVIRRLSGGI